MTLEVPKSFDPWLAGLYDVPAGSPADPTVHVSELLNLWPTREGTLKSRPGFRALGWGSKSLHAFTRTAVGRFQSRYGTEFILVGYRSADSFHTIQLYGAGLNQVIADYVSGVDAEAIPDFRVLDGLIYLAVGYQPIRTVDPYGTVRPRESIPSGRFLGYAQFRLWVGNLRDGATLLAVSAPGDLDQFDVTRAAALIELPSGYGDPITGVSPEFIGGDVFVTTRRSLFRVKVNTSVDIEIQTVSSGIGGYHFTFVQRANDMIWASPAGVHSLGTTANYGDYAEKFLSAPIQRLWDSIPEGAKERMQAVYWAEHDLYMLAVPGGGRFGIDIPADPGDRFSTMDDSYLLVLHVSTGRWSLWDVPATSIGLSADVVLPSGTSTPLVGTSRWQDTEDAENSGSSAWGILSGHAVDFPRGHVAASGFGSGQTHQSYQWGWQRRRRFVQRVTTHDIDLGDVRVMKNYRHIILRFRSGASSRGTVRFLLDDRWRLDAGERLWTSEQTFYLNQTAAIRFGSYHGDGIGTVLEDAYLTGARGEYGQVHIPIDDTGQRLKVQFEIPGDHRFELLGWSLYYIALGTARVVHYSPDSTGPVDEEDITYEPEEVVPAASGDPTEEIL